MAKLKELIFHILILPAEGIDLIYIEMTEMIGTYMRVCLASGIILAMPYLIYQLLMFVSPALKPKEKICLLDTSLDNTYVHRGCGIRLLYSGAAGNQILAHLWQ